PGSVGGSRRCTSSVAGLLKGDDPRSSPHGQIGSARRDRQFAPCVRCRVEDLAFPASVEEIDADPVRNGYLVVTRTRGGRRRRPDPRRGVKDEPFVRGRTGRLARTSAPYEEMPGDPGPCGACVTLGWIEDPGPAFACPRPRVVHRLHV